MEASALSRRGWSISAIARHLDRDRKTVRAYLAGEREPGVRRPAGPDPLAPFAAYVAARFADDPHLWASALFDEVVPLGYDRSYVSFARQLRLAGLRPADRVPQFEALYRANVAAVTAYFARRSAEPQTVADLTADTFVQAIMSFATFDPRNGTPRAGVFGIARRIYAAHCQARSQQRGRVERLAGRQELAPDEVGELIDRIDAERAGRVLVTGLTTLPVADRAVVELVDLAGLQPKEAAQVLGVAPGTLRMRLMRGRARLRKAASPDLAHGTDPAGEPEVKT